MTRTFLSTLALLAVCQGAMAADPTRKDAVALADRAAAVVAKEGAPKLLGAVNSAAPEWADKSLYVIVYDMAGNMVGHPFSPKMVGKNVLDVPDIDGKFFRKEILAGAQAAGTGWSDYKIRNPETNKIESKVSYYKRAGDVVLVVGIFADAK